jgi:hypothetical protein
VDDSLVRLVFAELDLLLWFRLGGLAISVFLLLLSIFALLFRLVSSLSFWLSVDL